ncbi:MAG: hypothetical protein GWN81_22140 [Phycisphaerae bacterium]|nr:hypothetical protein [Phycisphaerae bacterium]
MKNASISSLLDSKYSDSDLGVFAVRLRNLPKYNTDFLSYGAIANFVVHCLDRIS